MMQFDSERELQDFVNGYSNFFAHIERSDKATAQVTLLEGPQITIHVGPKGWQVQKSPEKPEQLDDAINNIGAEEPPIYETGEALFMSISPRFNECFNQQLAAKLEKLQKSQEN